MAESKALELKKQLADALGAYSTERNFSPEKFSPGQPTPKYVDSIYDQIYVYSQDSLTPQEVEDIKDPYSPYRYKAAMSGLEKMLAREGHAASFAGGSTKIITQGQTAKNIIEILEDPKKYGLNEDQQKNLIESAFAISQGADAINPDELGKKISHDELLNEAIERREVAALMEIKGKEKNTKTIEAQYAKQRLKIRKQITEEELEAARERMAQENWSAKREATLAFFKEKMHDKAWAGRGTNSSGELLSLEETIGAISVAGSAGTKIAPELLEKFSSQSSKVSALLGKADTAVQLYRDPKSFASTKIAKKLGVDRVGEIVAQKTAARVTGALVGTALNFAAPVIGQIVGFIAGKVVVTQIRNAWGGAKKLGMAAAGIILLTASTLGELTVAGLGSATGVAGMSAVILAPLVAFIVFMINAGGWVVPPGARLTGTNIVTQENAGTTGRVENPYIRVNKTPNPAGPFQNSQLPTTITYTIEVQARQQPLTNITFNYACQVIKNGPAIPCPQPQPLEAVLERAPDTIVPGEPFIVTYSVTYFGQYSDSLVMDNFTVRANVEGVAEPQEVVGFASIIFGNPPTGCFVLAGDWASYPAQRSLMLAAIGQLVRQTVFMQRLCSYPNGQVTLNYEPNPREGFGLWNGRGYWGHARSGGITFFPPAFASIDNAVFTLAHESGHVYHWSPAGEPIFRDMQDQDATSDWICTYPPSMREDNGLQRDQENFAESTALYFISNNFSGYTRDYTCIREAGGTFEAAYPFFYAFARDRIFR